MKNTKEAQPILTAIFALNQTSEHKDPMIATILDYAFRTFYGSNTNLLTLACIGQTRDSIMPQIEQILNNTGYKDYMNFKEALRK
ncbi:MAG: hypothetical protein IJW55_09470 [Clostridia bacterium]|nr:hypothetical protein [Clostridia bacterium]